MTELTLNFLIADDPCGLITYFEAGKVHLNLLFMSNYLFHVEILPLVHLPTHRASLSDG